MIINEISFCFCVQLYIQFEIDQIIRMCNEYTESVLHPSEIKSQIVKNTIEKQYGKKHSTDCYSNYSGKKKNL